MEYGFSTVRGSGPDATEIYSQDVTDYNINDWTEITLDTPYPIDASTNLWGGVYINMPNPGAPIGPDEGPLNPEPVVPTVYIDEEQVSEFRIYPNPATSGTLTISFDDPDSIDNITVFNSSGQLMLRENNISKRIQLDIGNLIEGLYIVKVSRTNGQTTTKNVVVK
jgi:hypothetical protein